MAGPALGLLSPTVDAGHSEALQAGVVNAGDCALTINSTTQVTIAVGTVWVTNASGLLVRTVTISTVLSGIPVATNARLDQIVVDSAGTVTRLAGTDTAGNTLANRTGAAAIPAGSQRLQDILVTSGGVTAVNVRDRRPWARGALARAIRTAGSIAFTSTSNVEISTSLTQRIECSGVPVRLRLLGQSSHGSVGGATYLCPRIDGAAPDSMTDIYVYSAQYANYGYPFATEYMLIPAAGSHLLSWAVRTSAGTTTLVATAAGPLVAIYDEIVRPNANNGTT